MKKEKILNYDQIMALFDKLALDAKRREEEAKRKEEDAKRREEAREAEEKRKEEAREAEEKRKEEAREAEEKRKEEAREAEEKRKEAAREAAREEEAKRREAAREAEEAAAKKRNEEAEKRLKKLEKLVGGIGKNNGHYAEEFFQNAFSKTLTFAGIKFDKMIRNMKIEKKETCELDIVLINGDTIAIIEAKNRVHPDFVKELATKKLNQFRKLFPEYANYRIYLGVAGLSFDDSVVEEANKFGIGIVRQDGKAVEINAEGIKVY